jgi:hypothetical protein
MRPADGAPKEQVATRGGRYARVVRDDVEWHASSDEAMAEIDRNMALARRHLERAAPHHDPIFDLPVTRMRWVWHRPAFVDQGERACGACARTEDDSGGGPYGIPVVIRSKVTCQLLPGHTGPHCAGSRRRSLGTYRTFEWGQ